MDLTSKLAKLAAGRCWDGYEPVPGKGAYTDDSCRKTGKKKKKREKSAKSPAWQRKSGKNSKGGLNEKGRKSYESENPGSDLKAPVTGKVKPGGKAAKRRKSFCARMSGNKGPMKKPNGEPTRKALSLRKWKCGSDNQPTNKDSVIMEDQLLRLLQEKLASNCGGSHAVPKKKKKKLKVKLAHCGCKKPDCPAPECVAERKEKESADLRLKLASHLIRHTLAGEKAAGAGMVGRSSAKVKKFIDSLKSFGKKTVLPATGTGLVGYGLGNYQGFGAGQDSLNDMSIQELVEHAMANKQASLKGDQHKLDVNKNGKIEGSDLKKLRGRGKNEKVALDRIRLKLASNVIKQAEAEGAGVASILARLGLILGGGLIGGGVGSRGAGALVRKFGKRGPMRVNLRDSPKMKETLEKQLGGISGGMAMLGGGLGGTAGGGILGNMGANALNKESALKGDQHKLDVNKNGKIEGSDLKKLRGRGVTKKAVAAQLIFEKVANDPYMSDMEKAAMLSAALKGLAGAARYGGRALQGAGNMGRYMGKGLRQGATAGGNLSRSANRPGMVSRAAGGAADLAGRGAQAVGGRMAKIRNPGFGVADELAMYGRGARNVAGGARNVAGAARNVAGGAARNVAGAAAGGARRARPALARGANAAANVGRQAAGAGRVGAKGLGLGALGTATGLGAYQLGNMGSQPMMDAGNAVYNGAGNAMDAVGDAAAYAGPVAGGFGSGLYQGAQNMIDGAQNVAGYVGDTVGRGAYGAGEAIGDSLQAASGYFPGGPRR